MPDITDRKTLESWLQSKPTEVAVAIASRAAQRVLPEWHWFFHDRREKIDAPFSMLALFRASLTTSIAPTSLTVQLNTDADSNVDTTPIRAVHATCASIHSTRAAGFLWKFRAAGDLRDHRVALEPERADRATSSARFSAISQALQAIDHATREYQDNMTAVQEDVKIVAISGDITTLVRTALWPSVAPSVLVADKKRLFAALADDPADWSFWTEWVNSVLKGGPQNWQMLEDIVLIPDAEWDKGPVHLNAMIAEIVQRFAPSSPDPENLPAAKRQALKQHVHLLLQTAECTEVTSLGMSQQIRIVLDQYLNAAGGLNQLPEELKIYESICVSFARIGEGIHRVGTDEARVVYLEKRILELECQIAELTEAAGSAVEKDFLDKVSDATAKSIGTAIGPVIVAGAGVMLTNYVDPGALNQLANHFSSYVTNRVK